MTATSKGRARAAPPSAAQIMRGDRRALARAITLIESTRPDHRVEAEALLEALLPATGGSIRVGISGPPGVGKSSFIEAFGLTLIAAGRSLAVLAVDPSSARSGGSILGDKTRMERLAREPAAFIRPSPAGGAPGGVARRTREAMLACEAAGFAVVLIETVGVGQSEAAVAEMTDLFMLLVQPGGGDDLQGIKRGNVELADLVVVTKADGALAAAAARAEADYRAALGLLRPVSKHWRPRVMACSALEGSGLEAVWRAIEAHREAFEASGELARRRAAQAQAWMWSELRDGLTAALKENAAVAALATRLEGAVAAGEITPGTAARQLQEVFLGTAVGGRKRSARS